MLTLLCVRGLAAAPTLTEAVLEVTLSAEARGESMVVLRGAGGILYLEDADFEKLRLRLPQAAAYEHEGHRYFAPAAIPGS